MALVERCSGRGSDPSLPVIRRNVGPALGLGLMPRLGPVCRMSKPLTGLNRLLRPAEQVGSSFRLALFSQLSPAINLLLRLSIMVCSSGQLAFAKPPFESAPCIHRPRLCTISALNRRDSEVSTQRQKAFLPRSYHRSICMADHRIEDTGGPQMF